MKEAYRRGYHHFRRYPLRYTQSGMIFMDPGDDCGAVVDAMLKTRYSEEFCLALDWNLDFVARLMKAGFLVMSETVFDEDEKARDIILPKLHLVRSALFFPDLRIKRSIRPLLKRYELRYDTDFEIIVEKCLKTHGDGWLTPSLISAIFALRDVRDMAMGENDTFTGVRPVSFGVYRDGELKAGEFGIVCNRVYTSYSGYKEENNAGTVQMILMIRWLEERGFEFLDFGMPLEYKTDLGAKDISPKDFVELFRRGQQVSCDI